MTSIGRRWPRKWTGATKCDWPNCHSKAIFKSFSSLKTHTLNIHVSPLVCTLPQCSYKKPFGKMYELLRHNATIHGNHYHKCPVEGCEAGFSRKDKMLNHIREKHNTLKCPYNHCSVTVLETEEELHLRQFHGDFECAIGACETGLKSLFLEVGLKRHLRKCHGISYDPIETIMSQTHGSVDRTARSKLRSAWKDCVLCSAQHGKESLRENTEVIGIGNGERSV